MDIDADVQIKYYDIPQRGKDGITAAQVIGGFLMDKGRAPWEAQELLIALEAAGFEITLC